MWISSDFFFEPDPTTSTLLLLPNFNNLPTTTLSTLSMEKKSFF